MHQPAVGQVRKPFERIVVGEADRLAAEIAGCHHQRGRSRLVAGQPEQQCVQRCVRQHHAEVGVVRRHRCRRPVRRAGAASARSVAAGRTAAAPMASSTSAIAHAVCQVGHHDGERLVAAALSAAQLGDRALVAGVAGQVVAADALDGEDAAVAQQLPGARQRRSRRR